MQTTTELEEYRPFGTLSNIDIFDYTAKLRYGRGLGLVPRQKARENGLVTPSSLLSFVFVAIFPFVALQIEDKSTDLK